VTLFPGWEDDWWSVEIKAGWSSTSGLYPERTEKPFSDEREEGMMNVSRLFPALPRLAVLPLIVGLSILASVACNDDNNPVTPPDGNGNGNGNGNTAVNHTVNMAGSVFSPATLSIAQGDTVTWVNNDNIPHTTTSGPQGAPNGIWNSGDMGVSAVYRRVFTSAGSFPYHCVYHNGMTGTVTVTQ